MAQPKPLKTLFKPFYWLNNKRNKILKATKEPGCVTEVVGPQATCLLLTQACDGSFTAVSVILHK